MNKKNRAKQFKKKKKDKKHLQFNSPHEVMRGYNESKNPKKKLSEYANTKTNLRDEKDIIRKASAKKSQISPFKIQKSSQNSLKLTRENLCNGFFNSIKNYFLKWSSFFNKFDRR